MNTRIAILPHTILSGSVAVDAHGLLDEDRVQLGPPGRDWAIVAAPEQWHVVRVFERGVACSCSRTMNMICPHAAAALTAWAERAKEAGRFEPEEYEQLELLAAELEGLREVLR